MTVSLDVQMHIVYNPQIDVLKFLAESRMRIAGGSWEG